MNLEKLEARDINALESEFGDCIAEEVAASTNIRALTDLLCLIHDRILELSEDTLIFPPLDEEPEDLNTAERIQLDFFTEAEIQSAQRFAVRGY